MFDLHLSAGRDPRDGIGDLSVPPRRWSLCRGWAANEAGNPAAWPYSKGSAMKAPGFEQLGAFSRQEVL